MALQGTKALERWCKIVTADYEGVSVVNMTTSWRSGLGFCAIVHHFRPDLLDFSTLDADDALGNNRLAFELAEQHLGIPALLDPQDMVECELLDRLSILTYLSQFFQVFRGSTAKGSSDRPQRTGSARSSNEAGPSSSPLKKPTVQLGRRNEVCRVCGKPVFILERLNVGGRLLHRTCFRCARCNAQLNVVSYYETEGGEYCCDVCPDEEVSMAETVQANKEKVQKHLDSEESSQGGSSDSEGEEERGGGDGKKRTTEDEVNHNGSVVVQAESVEEMGGNSNNNNVSKKLDANDNDAKCLPGEKDKVAVVSDIPSATAVDGVDVPEEILLPTEAEEKSKAVQNPEEGASDDDAKITGENGGGEICNDSGCHDEDLPVKEILDEDNLSKNKANEDDYEAGRGEVTAVGEDEDAVAVQNEVSLAVDAADDAQSLETEEDGEKAEEKSTPPEENSVQQSEIRTDEKLHAESDEPMLESDKEIEAPTKKEEHTTESELDSESAVFESADDGEGVKGQSSSAGESSRAKVTAAQEDEKSPSEAEARGEEEEEYPNEMNPFELEDEAADTVESQTDDDKKLLSEQKEMTESKATAKVSTNPFGSDFEESGEEEETSSTVKASSTLTPSTASLQPTTNTGPPKPPRAATAASTMTAAASKSLNPFGSDFEDDDEEVSRGPSPSPSSCSSVRSRKKRQAPLPPGVRSPPVPSPRSARNTQNLSPLAAAPVPAPRHSLSPASRRRPSPRPTRSAPKPPPPNPNAGNTASEASASPAASTPPPRPPPPSELAKERKDRDNLNRRSQLLGQQQQPVGGGGDVEVVLTPLSPDKATLEGQWKKKKGPAPPRPVPQKRQVKKLPRKAVNTELHDIEVKQRELERQGVKLETTIRELCQKRDAELKAEEGEEGGASVPPADRDSLGPEVEDLMIQLFDLVNEKNDLFRRQTELMYMRKDHLLEEEHADIEHKVRMLMAKPDSQRTDDDKMTEEKLIARLMEVVAQRNEIVDCLEMDRLR